MKRILICVVAIIVALAFASSIFAYPNLTQKTGKPCAYCHKDPKGTKDLTAAGQYYKKNNKLPSAAKAPAKTPAKKAPAKKAPAKKAGAGKGPGTAGSQYREQAPLK